MEISAPQVLKAPINVPKKLLMGPGPSNCDPRVLHAVSQQVIGHMHPECFKVNIIYSIVHYLIHIY